MARPMRRRRVCSEPEYASFSPDGICAEEPVALSVDEYEALRLVDYEGLTHEQCARRMDVSRTTVTDIYESARFKVADALVNGRALTIEGGAYRLCGGESGRDGECRRACCRAEEKNAPEIMAQNGKGDNTMRIAVAYEDGKIFQHFGHTEAFKLYDVEGGRVLSSQIINAVGSGHGALAGFLSAAKADAVICGGIGGGAVRALMEAGIMLFGGVSGDADEAVSRLLDGTLQRSMAANCSHHAEGHSCGDSCHSHGDGCHSHDDGCSCHG